MYHTSDNKEMLVKGLWDNIFKETNLIRKKLAFDKRTWYILFPAKKTRETRCGKRMK